MESFKEKLPMIIAVIIVIALIVGAYYFLVIHKDLYYTQIDNTKIQEIINKLGAENEILISDTGEIEKTIDVKEKSYYLIIKTNNFTGNVDILSE